MNKLKIKWRDSIKLAWFYFARSRGWKSSVTLSSGLHMEGADKTFTIQSPLYKFSKDVSYTANCGAEDTIGCVCGYCEKPAKQKIVRKDRR